MNFDSDGSVFGEGCLDLLISLLERQSPKKIFLVTGKSSYESSGAQGKVSKILQNHSYIRFSDFEVNPKIEDVLKGGKLFKSAGCDFVVAIGGGSVIDIAKCINAYQANSEIFDSLVSDSSLMETKGVPLVAIPTTSGTGSEATHFAVIYRGNTKYSIAHEFLLPDFSIIDPTLTFTLPKYVGACAGFDALSQAIESYWSVNSNAFSKKYALEAISLIKANIVESVKAGSKGSRVGMSKGAYLAGKAINISKTTAPHAISYAITDSYQLPHGHAVALSLGHFFLANEKMLDEDASLVQDPRGVQYVRNTMSELREVLQWGPSNSALKEWTALMVACGLQTKLNSEVGLLTALEIAERVNLARLSNHPIRMTTKKLSSIIDLLF